LSVYGGAHISLFSHTLVRIRDTNMGFWFARRQIGFDYCC